MTKRTVKRLIHTRRPKTLAEYMAQQRRVIAAVAASRGVTEMTALQAVAPLYREIVRHPAA